MDTKKKELVGEYKNAGAQWRPAGDPERVKVHDFIDKELGKANPYGVYDVGTNTGWVSVDTDHDTAAFTVNTIRSWWNTAGSATYHGATGLLITADGGGSNGYRLRLWKTELAALAAETGLEITVCHLPPGTSKWKIEHKLFSHIWHELARATPDQPRGHRQFHRRDHHHNRTQSAGGTRHRNLPHRPENPRPTNGLTGSQRHPHPA